MKNAPAGQGREGGKRDANYPVVDLHAGLCSWLVLFQIKYNDVAPLHG